MKKFWKTMMFAALGVFALSSCEDVPAPYDIPSGGGGETPAIIEPAGDGTLESPYNVAAANEACSALQQSNTSETYLSDVVYVKGVISQIDNVDPSYGNSTYYISDSGLITDQLEVYRGFYLDGARFTAADQIAVGDTVIVCGQLQNWLGRVNEFTSGSKIVYHNGASSEPDTPAGIEVTCAQAVELTNALEDNATSTEVYTVTGYITEVVGNVSRNQQTFWMADEKDGGNVFEAYWANLPEGVSAFKAGSKVKITGNFTKYVNNNGQVTAEINATVEILEEGGGETPVGTEITCAQAVELTNALENNATSTEVYTVTGYITEVVGNVSRNQQTFWMADAKDGGNVFEAYWANLPEGVSAFKAGSKVKITGNLTKYVNNNGQVTAEIKNADVEILDEGGDTPTGTDLTCAQAVELTNALADGATSTEVYTVTGYITEVVGNVSRDQQTFWMADTKDGGRVFEAYWANLPAGVSEFKAGSKVKITGNLMKYVNNSGQVTPEIKNADVEILDEGGGETPDTPTEGDVTIDASDMGLSNNTSWSTITVNGVTFTADGGGNSNTPKYFDNGSNLRMYPKNSLTISAGKDIESIVITCTSGSVANGNVGVSSGNVSVSDPVIAIHGINSKTVKITNNDGSTGAASQIRIESFAITFAE